MSCSSHSPPASHTGQSSGWFPSSISSIDLRACLISSLSVMTIMPSLTTVGARGLQLGHLLHLHQAHAASALQRKIGVVAERRHLDAHALAGLNEQRPRRSRELLAVNCEIYISHGKFNVRMPELASATPAFSYGHGFPSR